VSMSNKSNKRSFAFLVVFVLSIALAGADVVVLAQDNQNNDMQNSNMSNSNTSGKRRVSRRGTRRSSTKNANTPADMSGNANTDMSAGSQENTNTSETTTGTTSTGRRRGSRRGKGSTASADTSTAGGQTGTTAAGQPSDLSGTYSGVVNYPEGNLTGPATLTITGNQFTLTPEGGSPVSGRVSAVNTRGYTGVAMQLGDYAAPAAGGTPSTPPATVSLRARKSGNNISLSSVPGATHQFSFTPGSSAGGRRSRRGRAAATTGTTAETTTAPADTGTAAAGTTAETTTGTAPSTGRRTKRGGRRGNRNANANNSNMGAPTNSNNSNQ
jgi:hypothetical protein